MSIEQSVRALLPNKLMGVLGGTSPSAVSFNQKLYLFWVGSGKDGAWFTSFDGKKWTDQQSVNSNDGTVMSILDGTSLSAVSFKEKLYLFWVGSVDGAWFTSYNGRYWTDKQSVKKLLTNQNNGNTMSVFEGTNLSVVSFNQKLYLFWVGSDDGAWFTTFDGKTWADQQALNKNYLDGTSFSAVSFKEKLYLFWLGSRKDGAWFTTFDGRTWASPQSIKAQLPNKTMSVLDGTNLSSVSFNQKLYLFWVGSGKDGAFFTTFDGSTWTNQQSVKASLSNKTMSILDKTSPYATLAPNGLIYLFWNASSPGGIWYSDMVFNNSWMINLSPSLKISDVNLPGTHDSASITSIKGNSPYTTQELSITNQLEFGIRLFDVRIKVKGTSPNYVFVAAHGGIGLGVNVNEFQTLDSLIQEFERYLNENRTEFLVMTLKIDDWNGFDKTDSIKEAVRQSLSAFLGEYSSFYNKNGIATIPTVSDVRGKIVIFNRINSSSLGLGHYIDWDDNTDGTKNINGSIVYYKYTSGPFSYYAQDKYEKLPTFSTEEYKKGLYIDAIKAKQKSTDVNLLINFASATYFIVLPKPLIQYLVLNEFGKYDGDQRKWQIGSFGWTFFDYVSTVYTTSNGNSINIVSFIISSNFGYTGFDNKFDMNPIILEA